MLHKKPGTYVLNLRMDIRKFATIVDSYRNSGFRNSSCSTYARMGLEDFADNLMKHGRGRTFKSALEADDFLFECGLKKQSKSVRVSAALLSEIDLELTSVDSPTPTSASQPAPLAGELSASDVLETLLGKKRT